MKKVSQAEAVKISDALTAIGRTFSTDRFFAGPGESEDMFAITISDWDSRTGRSAIAYVGSVDEIPAAIKKVGAKLDKGALETLRLIAAEKEVNAE